MASEAKDKVDAAARVAAANAPGKPTGVALYSRFALAGAVCCAVTHGALTPVDVYVLLLFDIQIYNLFFFSSCSHLPSPVDQSFPHRS